MVSKHCCVPFCKSNSTNKIVSFHNFPKDPVLRVKWYRIVSQEYDKHGLQWTLTKWSCICSDHFTKADFSISTTRKILLPQTVPSIFPGNAKCRPTVHSTNVKNAQVIVLYPPAEERKLDIMNNDAMKINDTEKLTLRNHVSTQCSMVGLVTRTQKCKHENVRMSHEIYRLKQRVNRLKNKIKIMADKREDNLLLSGKMKLIKRNADNGELEASLLLEQIKAYGKKFIKNEDKAES